MSDALVANGLVRRFDDRLAVDHVSFSVASGETYGLLGPNGAGKTTTISIIAGLLAPDAGTVVIDGEEMSVGSVGPRAAVGLVPQELALYPDLTAEENLAFFGRLYGLEGDDLDERISSVLALVGLDERRHDRASGYSGGMKRRLNIAIGLLHRPHLLILDEPTVGVDPQSRNSILEAVEALSGQGMAVLYTTHYMEEAERLCDRVGIIDEGRLVAEGTRRQLVAQVGQMDRIDLRGRGAVGSAGARVGAINRVAEVAESEDGLAILAAEAASLLPSILAAATEAGMSVTSVEVQEPDLEAVFLHLTGKALRD